MELQIELKTFRFRSGKYGPKDRWARWWKPVRSAAWDAVPIGEQREKVFKICNSKKISGKNRIETITI